MNKINRLEKNSILYYQGGGENIVLENQKQNLSEFYNVDNSYIVINALLMPGISNEKARLQAERKSVDLSVFKHMDELVKVYCQLYSAMCKYTYFYKHDATYHTYRADRMNTLEFLRHGQMYSFMSTQKYNDKNEDFHNKDRILLLEVEADGSVEHIDVNAVLGQESKYPHEQEILFAPFASLDKQPLELTEEEKLYQDINGDPPKAKYLLNIKSSIVPCRVDKNKELKGLYQEITDFDSVNKVREIWKMLMGGSEPDAEAVQCYIEWKKNFKNIFEHALQGLNTSCAEHDLKGHKNRKQDRDNG